MVDVVPVEAAPEVQKESVRLVVMGDSMSDFAEAHGTYPLGNVTDESTMWYSLLGDRLPWAVESFEAFTLSDVGYTQTESGPGAFWGWNYFVGQTAPDVILLALGMDDPWSDPAAIENGLVATLDTLGQLWPETRVIVIIPPESDFNGVTNIEGTRAAFNAAWDQAAEAASERGVQVIDLRKCTVSRYAKLYMLDDGRHPNAAGMKAIADYIVNQLK